MKIRSIEFLREVEQSDADSRAVRMTCGWAADEIKRLEAIVGKLPTETVRLRVVAGALAGAGAANLAADIVRLVEAAESKELAPGPEVTP